MQLHFTGQNVEITQALKTFAEEKFKSLEKRYHQISQINVVFHVEHITQVAEATVHVNGIEIHATAKDNDMYTAINLLVEKLMGQINKQKEKLIGQHHQH